MTNPDAVPAAELRVVASWEGQREPIVLSIYGPDGEVAAVLLTPVRALELARDLTQPAVAEIKFQQWGSE